MPFETTPLPGFDARDASVTSVTTTIGGRVDWLGGVSVRFPGLVPETGKSWNDFGGWSTLVGDARGERLWTLTDNYAYLLRVELELDEQSSTLTNVRAIRNATDFAILVPADETRLASTRQATTTRGDEQFGDNDGAVKVARRVDVESIVSIPDATSDATGDATGEDGDYAQSGGLLADFAVGVEDSWELPANDVIRFRSGRRHAWTDVPGADDAFNACDANLGPEALVWLPKTGSEPATLVTFCETPAKKQTYTANALESRDDAVFGFAFPLRDDEDETETLATDERKDVFFFQPRERGRGLRFVRRDDDSRRRFRAVTVPLLLVPAGTRARVRDGDALHADSRRADNGTQRRSSRRRRRRLRRVEHR